MWQKNLKKFKMLEGLLLNKAFTLIELLAAIVLLAIVSIIAYPFVSNAIKGSKESALERTIDNLKHAAYTYSVENLYEQNIEERTISFDELFNMGYIKQKPINTITKEELTGCIMYKWENNQYSFRYEENCNIEQIEEFVINFKPLATSNNGWYKSNLFVNVTINGSYYDWCSSTGECSPTTRVTSKTGSVLISNQSEFNYVCVIAYDQTGNPSNKQCSPSYKLDKVNPIINGINDIFVNRNDVVDLTSGVSVIDDLSGIDGTYSYSPMSVDTSKPGTTNITYSVSDIAGNVNTITRKVIVDAIAPTVEYKALGNTINSNGWSKEDFFVEATLTDNSGLGIKSAKWCSTTNNTCEPIADMTNNKITPLINIESNNNRICIKATDNNEKTSDIICSDSYKLDKTYPTVTPTGSNITIKQGDSNQVSSYFNVSYSISGGTLSCSPVNTSGLAVGNQTVTCTATGGNGLQTTSNKSITVQALEYADSSGANKPELYNKMIPVTWNGSSWVYADISTKWYDYETKEWANAVVLNNAGTKSVGQTISESEIAMMFVWIPRYKYTIFNANNGSVSPQQINVVFESGTAKTGTVTCTTATSGSGSSSENCGTVTNGSSTYTHPAFTFGTKELTGIWVGKFENSAPNVTTDSVQKVSIKPNVISWRSATVSNFYQSILNIKTDYSMSGIDSHMMKNMEWGAVAYLTQSKYGLGTTDIGINNNENYTTGCGASAGSSSTTGCNAYNTTTGMLASTTGNIYGIYDMSGGAYEYVMGNMVNSSNQFNNSRAEFGTPPPTKYYDSYTYDSSYTMHSRGRLGDATKETLQTYGNPAGGWYSDYADFPNSAYPWFVRGGYCTQGADAGVFYFYSYGGAASSGFAARAVVSADDN